MCCSATRAQSCASAVSATPGGSGASRATGQHRREVGRVAREREPAVVAGRDQIRHAARVGRHDARARGERLEQHARHRFGLAAPIDDRRRAQRAAGLEMGRHARAIDVAREAHPLLEAELARERAQLAAERSVAERDEARARDVARARAAVRAAARRAPSARSSRPANKHEPARERALDARRRGRAEVDRVDAGRHHARVRRRAEHAVEALAHVARRREHGVAARAGPARERARRGNARQAVDIAAAQRDDAREAAISPARAGRREAQRHESLRMHDLARELAHEPAQGARREPGEAPDLEPAPALARGRAGLRRREHRHFRVSQQREREVERGARAAVFGVQRKAARDDQHAHAPVLSDADSGAPRRIARRDSHALVRPRLPSGRPRRTRHRAHRARRALRPKRWGSHRGSRPPRSRPPTRGRSPSSAARRARAR